mmetsp:Transcript_58548/g.171299  ORF Transcript_58548/g.171299 Transcript_58548/m.171299 type:complete len:244 (+) Transcript_58548:138-869(+)
MIDSSGTGRLIEGLGLERSKEWPCKGRRRKTATAIPARRVQELMRESLGQPWDASYLGRSRSQTPQQRVALTLAWQPLQRTRMVQPSPSVKLWWTEPISFTSHSPRPTDSLRQSSGVPLSAWSRLRAVRSGPLSSGSSSALTGGSACKEAGGMQWFASLISCSVPARVYSTSMFGCAWTLNHSCGGRHKIWSRSGYPLLRPSFKYSSSSKEWGPPGAAISLIFDRQYMLKGATSSSHMVSLVS